MAGTLAIGDKVVFTGPVSENTPARDATGVITRFAPEGVEVAMTSGRTVVLPAASWTLLSEFKGVGDKSMYLYALLAAVYGWWLWRKLKK